MFLGTVSCACDRDVLNFRHCSDSVEPEFQGLQRAPTAFEFFLGNLGCDGESCLALERTLGKNNNQRKQTQLWRVFCLGLYG